MWTIAGGILLAIAILIAIPWVFIGLRYLPLGIWKVLKAFADLFPDATRS